MKENRKIERRRFIRYLTGVGAVLVLKPSLIFVKTDHTCIEPQRLLTMLRQQIRRDFELGRTVELDGWIVSVTEARLCSMITKSNPGGISRRSSNRDR